MNATTSDSTRPVMPVLRLEYEPGVCNIGPEVISRRQRAGHVALLATVGLLAGLQVVGAPPLARALVALPAAGAASGYLQARLKFCAGFGSQGVFNFGALGQQLDVLDDEARAADRTMATRIGLASAAIGGGLPFWRCCSRAESRVPPARQNMAVQIHAAVLSRSRATRPFAGSEPLTVETVDLAAPGPGEVLVRIAAAGLCHSDLSVIDGSRPRPLPMVLGHEAAGVVEAAGPGVTEVVAGDHVVMSYVPTCGGCVPCLVGRPALCEAGARTNLAGTLLTGERRLARSDGEALNHHLGVSAFAERAVVAEGSVVKIDPDIWLTRAALFGCAVLTGVGAIVNTAAAAAGSSAVVFGLGGIGLSAVMGARLAGCHPIVAVDIVAAKLDLALDLGATDAVLADQPGVLETIRALTDGGGQTVVEAAGSAAVLAQAYAATRRGGTTVSTGLPDPTQQLAIPAVSLVTEERTLKGSYMGSSVPRRDVPRYLALAEAGRLPVDRLMSGTIDLDDINAGFDALADGSVVRQLVVFPAGGAAGGGADGTVAG